MGHYSTVLTKPSAASIALIAQAENLKALKRKRKLADKSRRRNRNRK